MFLSLPHLPFSLPFPDLTQAAIISHFPEILQHHYCIVLTMPKQNNVYVHMPSLQMYPYHTIICMSCFKNELCQN